MASNKIGRPAKHPTAEARKAASAVVAKRYRDKRRAARNERRDEAIPLRSALIDLSALPAWKRR